MYPNLFKSVVGGSLFNVELILIRKWGQGDKANGLFKTSMDKDAMTPLLLIFLFNSQVHFPIDWTSPVADTVHTWYVQLHSDR